MLNSYIKTSSGEPLRVEILVRGTVQGVGFRPFIYRLASRFRITGSVLNGDQGVIIHAQAPEDRLDSFIRTIKSEAPPLARITSVETRPRSNLKPAWNLPEGRFIIQTTTSGGQARTTIPPDISLCADCAKEITNPADRRYRYPFTNCTNCGPRYTIVENIPYDRPKTSMKKFAMCKACRAEYQNPQNRRFHAQPNACPECGPHLSFHTAGGVQLPEKYPLAQVAAALAHGDIVAIKGLGGFHLAVDACSEKAIKRLRARKRRPDKPLAVMVADTATAATFSYLSAAETKLLNSPEHPIVLLQQKERLGPAPNIAPGIGEIGVMLPYTPLHHLLLAEPGCPQILVVTSGNISGEPICTSNEEALDKLQDIVDAFLLHNRDIVTRVDDSVLRVITNKQTILRRSRGYVPAGIEIQQNLPPLIACGAGLKNTFALARDTSIIPSQHIGDLDNAATYDFYLESIANLKKVYQLEPEIAVCDLHPDYPPSVYAAELNLPLYRVQHHHAHAAAVMAEHGIEEEVLAVVLDGTGLGMDNTIWGGEILKASLTGFERMAHLSHLRLPGGDIAAIQPWRMGLAALFASYGSCKKLPAIHHRIDQNAVTTITSMLEKGFNSPLTSSCGRLFDAVASLLGVRQHTSYEGQAAMELESLAQKAKTSSWIDDLLNISGSKNNPADFYLEEINGLWEIQTTGLIKMVVQRIEANQSPAQTALYFHTMLINSMVQLLQQLAETTGIRRIVLSGGCMQNSLLLEGLTASLTEKKLQVFTSNSLPANDGAISVGQAIIGGFQHVSGNSNESDSSSG